MILAVLNDGDGQPVCSEMWPGNTADVSTLIRVIDRLRRRFDIARVCMAYRRNPKHGKHQSMPDPEIMRRQPIPRR
jgi:hypothetical protein